MTKKSNKRFAKTLKKIDNLSIQLSTLSYLAEQALKHYLPKPMQIDTSVLAYRFSNHQLIKINANISTDLDDLQNINKQKAQLIQNTEQFLHGYPANHVLMTGARGVGKSSLVKALLKKYAKDGLRVIEVSCNDLKHLEQIRQAINHSTNPNRYIIYCDDLAFDHQDENYRILKSVLDGAMDSSDDVLIYATSNRRHLLPQLMKDNHNIYHQQTNEVNPYEVIDETVSLSDRFGLWLSFYPMTQDEYLQIVRYYLDKVQIVWTDDIQTQALRFASLRGNRSGRLAHQFSRYYVGKTMLASHTETK